MRGAADVTRIKSDVPIRELQKKSLDESAYTGAAEAFNTAAALFVLRLSSNSNVLANRRANI
jgi:hypothetical protein